MRKSLLPHPDTASSSSQARGESLVEGGINVVVGYALAIAVQRYVYPVFGIATSFAQDGLIALIFTAVSFARSYAVPRLFVWIERCWEQDRRRRVESLERRLATGKL